MTTAESNLVEKWNEMLKAAKEVEAEGIIDTQFAFTLGSNNRYIRERQLLALELNKCFIMNGYNLKD